MRTLHFLVEGQKLRKDGDFSGIIQGSKNYLKCEFNTDSDNWARCKEIAVFIGQNGDMAIPLGRDHSCLIPNEIASLKNFKIRLVGVGPNEYRISTNLVLISQER